MPRHSLLSEARNTVLFAEWIQKILYGVCELNSLGSQLNSYPGRLGFKDLFCRLPVFAIATKRLNCSLLRAPGRHEIYRKFPNISDPLLTDALVLLETKIQMKPSKWVWSMAVKILGLFTQILQETTMSFFKSCKLLFGFCDLCVQILSVTQRKIEIVQFFLKSLNLFFDRFYLLVASIDNFCILPFESSESLSPIFDSKIFVRLDLYVS